MSVFTVNLCGYYEISAPVARVSSRDAISGEAAHRGDQEGHRFVFVFLAYHVVIVVSLKVVFWRSRKPITFRSVSSLRSYPMFSLRSYPMPSVNTVALGRNSMAC